ncbi:MAG: Acetyl esterase/lipase [Verrucomicrobiaceae bacterium]|nr:Acetyl esterase/lipase [Verrucomicrobiaceae bacterium]
MLRVFSVPVFALCLLTSSCKGQVPALPKNIEVRRDVPYASTSNAKQTLDLFLPKAKTDKPRPLIVSIHGGGWSSGDKGDSFIGVLQMLIQDGVFAGASLNYRLTNEARWPEQIYDCKAAIRWLRAHAVELNIDPKRIGVVGGSAGGHLASLLGTSSSVPELEGTLGAHAGVSSAVQCVVNSCGPENFLTIGDHPSLIPWNAPGSIGSKLLGSPIPQAKELARAASPVTYITPDDAPVMTVHGTKDTVVPFEQATEFREALKKAGVPNVLITGKDGGHVCINPEVLRRMRLFLDHWLVGKPDAEAMEDKTVKFRPVK